MMSLWDALRMNMMISYQELVRTFPNLQTGLIFERMSCFNPSDRESKGLHINYIINKTRHL
ncbi:hypothetical protein EI054_21610 [Escherichia coli]|nr:hypothetical protein [Escherichia coli]PPX40613.1 hypothetical protein C5P06_21310 [Escherichia coli]BDD24556.1 hypothetical protein VEGS18_A22110 [Escherichia coli]